MHTEPKSSVDILEHVTEGGVHVETFDPRRRGPGRSFQSVVAVVETETYSNVAPAITAKRHSSRD